ncbi:MULTISPECIES: carboxylesterase/lipase family protein [Gordonia]|uniref:carboxylesterase/lipase family protein n=1 Tax=Gordonia TaxID=2053 RepID=UPI00133189B7|nr:MULTISPECIES: carboxylesterase/lipase family protein [Gordonia]KAF0971006.1 Para-nitrobenzyl esterase [Gordonia sp. YY1]UPW13048.1 carboxylesterase/lipase family protein [Gordonia amicalis]
MEHDEPGISAVAETTSASPVADPLARTALGTYRGVATDRADVWRGIRYARPPLDDLRWRRARPLIPDGDADAVIDAQMFGAVCPQELNPAVRLGPDVVMDEDCLFLNVWTPPGASEHAHDAVALPVMVWLHGGAYVLGSGSQPYYDGAALAATGDVVIVTLNYRLGVLGFADLSSIDPRFESNVGLSDVLTALAWVRDHISAFGGDPDKVTLFGESAGAGLVTALLTMPAAEGLFGRAIAQSSPVTSMYGAGRAARVAQMLLETAGVEDPGDTAGVVERLESLDGARCSTLTTELFAKVPTESPGTIAFAPVVDGDLLPEHPLDVYRDGRALPVPLIIGTNRDEANLFKYMKSPLMPITTEEIERMFAGMREEYPEVVLPERAQVLSAYSGLRPKVTGLGVARDVAFRMPTLWLADAHAHRAPVYVYRYDWTTRMFRLLGLGAAHATEVPYVWGNLGSGPRDITFLLGGRRHGEAVSERLMRRWTSFAHGRAPDAGPLGDDWPTYDTGRRPVLRIDAEDRVVQNLDGDLWEAWGEEVLGFR